MNRPPRDLSNDIVASGTYLTRPESGSPENEGRFTIYGKRMTAADSLRMGALPIGLAHNMILNRDIAAGSPVCWADVHYDATSQAISIRREMEAMFRLPG